VRDARQVLEDERHVSLEPLRYEFVVRELGLPLQTFDELDARRPLAEAAFRAAMHVLRTIVGVRSAHEAHDVATDDLLALG